MLIVCYPKRFTPDGLLNKKLRGLEDLGVFYLIYYPLALELLLLLLPPPLLELLLLEDGVVIFFNRSYQKEEP